MHAMIETAVIGFLSPAAIWFVARQYRQLQRINRGVRLLNYIVDRANEREDQHRGSIHPIASAEAA